MTLIDPQELAVAEKTFWLGVVNTAVLSATFVVLIFYTLYTRRMQQAVVRQVEEASRQTAAISRQVEVAAEQTQEIIRQRMLSILPAFILRPGGPVFNTPTFRSTAGWLYIRNIGNGPALNVEIGSVPIRLEGYPVEARVTFPRRPIIDKGGEWETFAHRHEGFGDRERINLALRDTAFANYLDTGRYTVSIRFTDIEGRGYVQDIEMDAGACKPGAVRLTPRDE